MVESYLFKAVLHLKFIGVPILILLILYSAKLLLLNFD